MLIGLKYHLLQYSAEAVLTPSRICEHSLKIYIPQDKYFYILYMDINTNSEIYLISSWNNNLNFLSTEFLH